MIERVILQPKDAIAEIVALLYGGSDSGSKSNSVSAR